MTFPNPRLHSTPAERRFAKVAFAERFVSDETIADNGLSFFYSHADFYCSRGLHFPSYLNTLMSATFALPPRDVNGKFSFFVEFDGVVQSNNYFHFVVKLGGKLTQSVFTGSTLLYGPEMGPLPNASYNDGGVHHLALCVDSTEEETRIFFDSITAVSDGYIPDDSSSEITFRSNRVLNVRRALVVDRVLTQDDFDTLKNESFSDFYRENMFAMWRCDEFGDDNEGQYIRDVGLTKPLNKGDRDGGITRPLLVTVDRDSFYSLSPPVTYIDGAPELPNNFCISACASEVTDFGNYQFLSQENNDPAFLNDLATPGGFSFRVLNNIYISNRALNELEKCHLEYIQTHDANFSVMRRAAADIIREGACLICLSFEAPVNPLINIADIPFSSPRSAVATGAVFDAGSKLYFFLNTSDRLNIAHSDTGRGILDRTLTEFTVIAYGPVLRGDAGGSTIVSKGIDFRLSVTSDRLYFNGTSYAEEAGLGDGSKMFAVSGVSGFKPRFFRDDHFIGEGDSTVTVAADNTDDWTFGNNFLNSSNFANSSVRCFMVFNQALTDREIISIYYSLQGNHDV